MKNILKVFIIFFIIFLNTSCGLNSNQNTENNNNQLNDTQVDIKSLSAKLIDLNNNNDDNGLQRKSLPIKEKKDTADLINQNIALFPNESEIEFTIELDNPKGAAIDAVEIYCSDPNSEILMDEKYEKIQHSSEGTIVMNWGQENPYNKTYNIKTVSEENNIIVKIVDIKIDGKWRQKQLSNNEFNIYRLDETIIEWKYIINTPNFYKWTFNYDNSKVEDIVVKIDNQVIKPDENGIYTITKNGLVTYEFVLHNNNDRALCSRDKFIDLLTIIYPQQTLDEITYYGENVNYYFTNPFDNVAGGNCGFCYEELNMVGTDFDYSKHTYKIILNESIVIDNLSYSYKHTMYHHDFLTNIITAADWYVFKGNFDFVDSFFIESITLYIDNYEADNLLTRGEWQINILEEDPIILTLVDYDETILYEVTLSGIYCVDTIPDPKREGYIFSGWTIPFDIREDGDACLFEDTTSQATYHKIGEPSEGLTFELSSTGKYYIATGVGNCTESVIEIPSTYKGLPVKEVKDFSLPYKWPDWKNRFFRAIIIPEGVEKIHDNTFTGNTNSIKNIYIPSTLKYIGENTLNNFSNTIKFNVNVDNPYFITHDGSLYSHDFKTFYAYSGHIYNTNINILEGVECIKSNALLNLNNIKVINLPNSLKTIENNSFLNVSEVYYNGTIEEWCSIKIEEVGGGISEYIPSIYMKDLNDDFYKLDEIILPNTISVINENQFSNFKGITKVVIPDSVKIINSNAFANCSLLRTFEISKSVTKIETNVFSSCRSLQNINVDINNKNYSSADGILYNKEMDTLIVYPSGKLSSSFTIPAFVKKISSYAFSDIRNLRYLNIPKTVVYIELNGVYNCYDTQIYCEIASKPYGWCYYNDSDRWCNTYYNVVWNHEFVY